VSILFAIGAIFLDMPLGRGLPGRWLTPTTTCHLAMASSSSGAALASGVSG